MCVRNAGRPASLSLLELSSRMPVGEQTQCVGRIYGQADVMRRESLLAR